MGLVDATYLPMGLHILPVSPNDDPSLAQRSPGVVSSRQKKSIFFSQPMLACKWLASLVGAIRGTQRKDPGSCHELRGPDRTKKFNGT